MRGHRIYGTVVLQRWQLRNPHPSSSFRGRHQQLWQQSLGTCRLVHAAAGRMGCGGVQTAWSPGVLRAHRDTCTSGPAYGRWSSATSAITAFGA